MEVNEIKQETAILVGLNFDDGRDFDKSMREMAALAEATWIVVLGTVTQNLPRPNTGTYVGSGKIEEIRAALYATGAELVLFDNQLTPMQQRNLANELECNVLDRTGLILRIFAERAGTREAKLQVETARLQYLLPRLAGSYTALGRQGGTSGAMSNRGAGETKIELDRRKIEHRISELRKELEVVDKERETQRTRRIKSGLPLVSLVGYTNAGKSTILNSLLSLYGAENQSFVFEKDMLFATLDTSIRKIKPGKDEKPFLLADTVGFISNLPTTLVKAFRSTLEEATYADLLLIVSDLSDPDYRANVEVTVETLNAIGAGDIPRIFVFNKADKVPEYKGADISLRMIGADDERITMSAKNTEDMIRLVALIGRCLNKGRVECDMLIPYSDGGALARISASCDMRILDYTDKGTKIHAFLDRENKGRYKDYIM